MSSNRFNNKYRETLFSFFQINKNPIIWCYTGGGHLFDENLAEIKKINGNLIPIIFIFSKSGVLVANRYGFFWNLANSKIKRNLIHFIFDMKLVYSHNVLNLVEKGNFSYSFIPNDPAFSLAVSLANSDTRCIIASPLTSNSVAKLTNGIIDTFVLNILSSGLKSHKKIAVVPTDCCNRIIKTKLPVRQRQLCSLNTISPDLCEFGAIQMINSLNTIYLPEYCTGCLICVKKYPKIFSCGDLIEMKMREIDLSNIKKLQNELTVLQEPKEISTFLNIS